MNADIQVWTDADTGQVNTYPAGKPNIFRQGQIVYAQEGCASCHTQMIRPTYMGWESWRPDFGKEGTIEENIAFGVPTDEIDYKKVFKERPIIGSTKSQTGHALGAAGVLECIYSILMLKNKFIAESLNLSDPIDEAEDLVMANQLIEKKDFSSFMSNSFGFGGTNASIVVKEFN